MARRAPSPLPRRWNRGPSVAAAAMLAAIGGSAALLVALFMLGRGEASWSTAGGVLVVACLGICLWGALQGRRTEADIDDAVALMIANRQARYGPRASPRGPERASREAEPTRAASWRSARETHNGRIG